jgi:hypothetical protein
MRLRKRDNSLPPRRHGAQEQLHIRLARSSKTERTFLIGMTTPIRTKRLIEVRTFSDKVALHVTLHLSNLLMTAESIRDIVSAYSPLGYLQIISDTKRIIDLCLEAVSRKNDAEINTRFDELRTKLHEMEFYEFPKLDVLIKKSKVLEDGGLKRIFEGPGALQFPWDIKADAETLYSRWMNGDRDPSLLRGLATTKSTTEEGKKRYSHKLDSHYTQRRPADVVGPNGLSNGQWYV